MPPLSSPSTSLFFFFNDTATTEIYTLSLHDALPICGFQRLQVGQRVLAGHRLDAAHASGHAAFAHHRSEEHTSELQSHLNLVCRLLLEKKKTPSVLLYSHSPSSRPS